MNPNRLCILGLLALIAFGAWIRLAPIGERLLWSDEAAHWMSTSSRFVTYEQFFWWEHEFESAPLSFVLPRLVLDLTGSEEEWALRLASAICGILCIPVGYLLGRVAHSHVAGLIVAALVTVDPNMVDSAQQARMYAVLMLTVLVAVTWAIHLMRHPEVSKWQWAGVGVVLALAFNTTQFGLALWFGVAVGALALLVGGRIVGQPHPQPKKALVGGVIAYVSAMIVSAVGLRLLVQRLGKGEGDGADMTIPGIAREMVVNAKELINLSPDALVISIGGGGGQVPLVELALYGLGFIGVILLFRHCKTSTAILVAVAAGNLLMMFPFRKMHHFMAPRYLSLIQPALWVGWAMLVVGFHRKSLRTAGLVIVLAYLGAQTWQSLNIQRWWQQQDRYLVAEEVVAIRDALRESPDEAVAYHPRILDKLGVYYDLPTDPLIVEPIYEVNRVRDDAKIPAEFDAPVTWMVVGMVNYDGRIEKATRAIDVFAAHYGVGVDREALAKQFELDRVYLLRFDHTSIRIRSIGVGEEKPTAFVDVNRD